MQRMSPHSAPKVALCGESQRIALHSRTLCSRRTVSQSPIKVDEAMKSIMDYNSKFGKIALDTVKKNTELSQTWAKESLSALDPFVKSTEKPEDFMKIATDYVSSQTQSTPKHIAEFAEVAKKAQLETIDLMMKAGKDAQEELTNVTKKASSSKE